MPKKRAKRYGDYTEYINGDLYASVNIPLGNGKYRKKRKRVDSPTEARNWALSQLHKQGDEPTDKITFAALAEWYKKEFLVAPAYQNGKRLYGLRTYERQKTLVDRLERTFGLYRLNHITVDVLRRYKRERLQTVSITAVDRDFALLRTMFKRARGRKWMRENPFDSGERLIEISLESRRQATLTQSKAVRLLARSRKSEQPLLYYLILVMMHTGARPSEVFPYEAKPNDGIERDPLKWQFVLEFDFQAVRLVSYKGRVRRERIVPATIELERGLRKMYLEKQPKPNDLLFPQSSFKRAWLTLCKSARVKGVVLRDFRRYFNTQLLNRKLDEVSRMLILGHYEIATNVRYASIDAEFIKQYRATVQELEQID